jgi:hypothetical protein
VNNLNVDFQKYFVDQQKDKSKKKKEDEVMEITSNTTKYEDPDKEDRKKNVLNFLKPM